MTLLLQQYYNRRGDSIMVSIDAWESDRSRQEICKCNIRKQVSWYWELLTSRTNELSNYSTQDTLCVQDAARISDRSISFIACFAVNIKTSRSFVSCMQYFYNSIFAISSERSIYGLLFCYIYRSESKVIHLVICHVDRVLSNGINCGPGPHVRLLSLLSGNGIFKTEKVMRP